MIQPLISIIVPVYNAENSLEYCVESLLNQSFWNFEILLINDGSTDRSGQICDNFTLIDNRVIAYHKLNGGASSARNVGLQEAKGKWITFMDSDDSAESEWLELFVANCKDVDIVIQNFKIISDKLNKKIKEINYKNDMDVACGFLTSPPLTIKYIVYQLSKNDILGYLWCKMFRKDVIERFNIRFNSTFKLMEDEDFVLTYMRHVEKCAKLNTGFYIYKYPDYNSKYLYNEACIRSIWESLKLLYDKDDELRFFANKYASYYIKAIVQQYIRMSFFATQSNNLQYYISEFYRYEIKQTNLIDKIFYNLLIRELPTFSDALLKIVFKLIYMPKQIFSHNK